jgi:hypothetical protein
MVRPEEHDEIRVVRVWRVSGQAQCSTTYRARWCSIECRVADRLNRIAISSRYYVRHNHVVNRPGRAAIIASRSARRLTTLTQAALAANTKPQ